MIDIGMKFLLKMRIMDMIFDSHMERVKGGVYLSVLNCLILLLSLIAYKLLPDGLRERFLWYGCGVIWGSIILHYVIVLKEKRIEKKLNIYRTKVLDELIDLVFTDIDETEKIRQAGEIIKQGENIFDK